MDPDQIDIEIQADEFEEQEETRKEFNMDPLA